MDIEKMKNLNVKIKGQNVSAANFLTTLTAKEKRENDDLEFTSEITFASYTDLALTISDLIGVAACALQTHSDNDQFSERSKDKILGANTLSVQRILLLAKQLIPFAEFEFLTELKDELEA